MGDITSTSFGLLIGFLLPGLTALYGLTFWSKNAKETYRILLTTQSNVGLFLAILLAGIAVGLMLTLLRWVAFEKVLCKADRLDTGNFKNLREKERLEAFRAAADEHYRYHQFWGGMTFTVPFLAIGWLREVWGGLSPLFATGMVAALIGLELLTVCGARAAYRLYVHRSNNIMK